MPYLPKPSLCGWGCTQMAREEAGPPTERPWLGGRATRMGQGEAVCRGALCRGTRMKDIRIRLKMTKVRSEYLKNAH